MQEMFFELIFIATAENNLLMRFFFSKSSEIIKVRSEYHELIEIIIQCTKSKNNVYLYRILNGIRRDNCPKHSLKLPVFEPKHTLV